MATASASAAKPAAGTARNHRSAMEPATWSASVRTSGTGRDGFKVRMRSRTVGTSASGSPVVRTTRCDTPVGARLPRDVYRARPRRVEPAVLHVADDRNDR